MGVGTSKLLRGHSALRMSISIDVKSNYWGRGGTCPGHALSRGHMTIDDCIVNNQRRLVTRHSWSENVQLRR